MKITKVILHDNEKIKTIKFEMAELGVDLENARKKEDSTPKTETSSFWDWFRPSTYGQKKTKATSDTIPAVEKAEASKNALREVVKPEEPQPESWGAYIWRKINFWNPFEDKTTLVKDRLVKAVTKKAEEAGPKTRYETLDEQSKSFWMVCKRCVEEKAQVPCLTCEAANAVPESQSFHVIKKIFHSYLAGTGGEPQVVRAYHTSKTGTAIDIIADILPHFSLFTILYLIGLLGMIFNYKNFLVTMMSVELMYLGVVANFVLVSLFGWIAAATHALLMLITAASDSAVGLGLLIVIYRFNRSIAFDAYKELHSTYNLDI